MGNEEIIERLVSLFAFAVSLLPKPESDVCLAALDRLMVELGSSGEVPPALLATTGMLHYERLMRDGRASEAAVRAEASLSHAQPGSFNYYLIAGEVVRSRVLARESGYLCPVLCSVISTALSRGEGEELPKILQELEKLDLADHRTAAAAPGVFSKIAECLGASADDVVAALEHSRVAEAVAFLCAAASLRDREC
ncbi:MAG: hypothetical protein IPM64_11305 [Phycisphaerales bacterium]|nr:hypothetical protein [Phycisphaerales bacterium]